MIIRAIGDILQYEKFNRMRNSNIWDSAVYTLIIFVCILLQLSWYELFFFPWGGLVLLMEFRLRICWMIWSVEWSDKLWKVELRTISTDRIWYGSVRNHWLEFNERLWRVCNADGETAWGIWKTFSRCNKVIDHHRKDLYSKDLEVSSWYTVLINSIYW